MLVYFVSGKKKKVLTHFIPAESSSEIIYSPKPVSLSPELITTAMLRFAGVKILAP